MTGIAPSFKTPDGLQPADLQGITKSLRDVVKSHKRLQNVQNRKKKRRRYAELNKAIDVLTERVLNPVPELAAKVPVGSLFGSSRAELKFEIDQLLNVDLTIM